MKALILAAVLLSTATFADELKKGPPPGGPPGGMRPPREEGPPPPRLTPEQHKVFEACLRENGITLPSPPPEGGPPPRPPENQRKFFHDCHDKAVGLQGKVRN